VAVDVVLIDRTNHYLFQPLLYQVATGLLSPADIAMPTRFLLRRQRNATVIMMDIDRIDLARREVSGDGQSLTYDYLIVATGARHAYFGHPDWEPLAPGLKTLEDARRIRHRFLTAFEAAEKSDDPHEQEALLTFVIIGGGPTGVELAGVLPTIARKGMRPDFRRIDPGRARVILLEGGPRLLPTFPDALSARTLRDLQALGVECRVNALVTKITDDAVYIGDERIATRSVFWAAGNAASPLVRAMGVPTDRQGRALVLPDLSVPGHPEVFVAGDAAAAVLAPADAPASSASHPQYVPGLAAAANQMGEHAAAMIARSLTGEPRTPFRYRNKGTLAVIGRGRAVADFGRFTLTGVLAWWTWLLVHIAYLAGFRNRIIVLLEWAYAYLTFRPGARLISEESHSESQSPNPKSQTTPKSQIPN
jgi:NADH dehydrogenase